jgi:hypothetical protein
MRLACTSSPTSRAIWITASRVMPISAEVSSGSYSLPFFTMNRFSPGPSAA